jgi:hypothetical protein
MNGILQSQIDQDVSEIARKEDKISLLERELEAQN